VVEVVLTKEQQGSAVSVVAVLVQLLPREPLELQTQAVAVVVQQMRQTVALAVQAS
jgi:hypothetical protein